MLQDSVKALLNHRRNENSQNIDETQSINQTYNSINIDDDNESSRLITESIQDNNQSNEKNPFKFSQTKIIGCNKCGYRDNPSTDDNECYSLDLNEVCNSLDNCFNLKFQMQCDNCKNNIEYVYKFKSTPEVLILKFNNPKEKKYFIKLNIEQDIDLKKYLLGGYVMTKYKLIKALYVYDDENDNFLYIDIPESEKKNYIPYIIIYKNL